MSKKHLDVSKITNELQGASLYFQRAPVSPTVLSMEDRSAVTEPLDDHTITPSHLNTGMMSHQKTSMTSHQNTVTPSHLNTITPERAKKKHGFVVYRDQVESLEKIVVTQWQRSGQKPEVGEIIREALDYVIEKKRKELDL